MELNVFTLSFLSILIVSLTSFAGVLVLLLKRNILNRITFVLVGLATGALFGDVFFHLLPEIYKGQEFEAGIFIALGILMFFILEKFLRWRHKHTGEEDIKPVAFTNLVGDSIHNFIDGVLITASYITNTELGIATTLAIILHEIPQEIGDFGVLIHSGFSVKKALLLNFLSALISFIGMGLAFTLSQTMEYLISLLLPITAGAFIYIAGSDLIPELHTKESFKDSLLQMISIILGITLLALLALHH